MNDIKNFTPIKTCNNCHNLIRKAFSAQGANSNIINAFCGATLVNKLIDVSIKDNSIIKIPTWCPNRFKTSQTSSISQNNVSLVKENKDNLTLSRFIKGKKIEDLNYMEQYEAWNTVKPLLNWDDIKVNETYYIAPYLNKKRTDIVIKRKTDYMIEFSEINADTNKVSTIVETMYKSSLPYKFIRPHKIRKMVKI